ncbi:polysaccharide biosynthesis C-terminal domain-containing protein [Flavobacterium sp. 5]|uniref:MATE family efflux transporter n=1 Tax=Flavobacterium sp. 5 TaxID=2035199 RepID=UPI000C2BD50D|nr:polysaccharide biosynthesis C-terminal domain-containing protein [Flavobacterium sp. 5]PKB16750.1 O-antigen/teichoic acid export membrane protein [Flavobacterium sp. 5]
MLEKIRKKLLQIKQNSLVQQSLITLIFRVLGLLTLFGFTLFFTKTYSPKIVGQYDFVRSFLLVIGSFCLLGCDQSILYFKGRLSDSNSLLGIKKIYTKMIGLLLMMSLLFLALFSCINKQFINNYFSDSSVYDMFLKSILVLFFYGVTTLNTEVFRALDHFYIAELFRNTIKYIPLIVGAILLPYYDAKDYFADVFLSGFILLSIITTILLFFYFGKAKDEKTIIFTYKELFTKSYPIAISGVALFLLMSFDIFFLKKYRDNETVAFYSVAIKLMTILSMVIVTVNITISTKIAEYFFSQNRTALIQTVKHTSRLIFFFTFPAVLIICFFPAVFLGFFGKDYIAAKDALLILIMGQGICSAFGAAPIYLNMTGRQHIFQIILIIAVFINFVLNRILIPEYGMTGAATAFVVSSFFWNCTSAIVIYKKDKLNVFLN